MSGLTKVATYFDTTWRTAGTIENPTFVLNPNGLGNGQGVASFWVDTCAIPFSFYEIKDFIFKWEEFSGGVYNQRESAVPDGNYTPNQLGSALATAMANPYFGFPASQAYIVSYDAITSKYTIQGQGAVDWRFYNFFQTAQIGFTEDQVTGTIVKIGNAAVDFLYSKHNIYVKCTKLQSGSSTAFFKNEKSSVILQVPVTGSPGDLIQFRASDLNRFYIDTANLSDFEFELVDELGVRMDLNGVNWSIGIIFETGEP